ncbi:hydrolase [Pseudoduganella flava]|uniref:Hydrolase n=1 Tax=Pseudoduganella flava TaxID=871742 RepID=A0ABX6FXT5_9BURK|nr:hydrolase [Pseudoduganella flava]QGZ42329.1 hydrolase [Pseudoduganella flava]
MNTYLGPLDGLLDRAPLPLETGIARLPNGCLLVAVRTDLPGCRGRMVDWWFKFFETTQHIRWWHPHDHVAHYGWDRNWKKGQDYVGATIHAVESLAGIPPVAAQLKFRDPRELFGAGELADAEARGDISAAVYASIGFGDDIAVDDEGDPRDGRMLHLVRDTPYGCVLRSRFLLGLAADEPRHAVPDALGLNLMRHCYTEFTYLSRFLPSLYYGEHANGELAPLPW